MTLTHPTLCVHYNFYKLFVSCSLTTRTAKKIYYYFEIILCKENLLEMVSLSENIYN